MLCGCCGAGSEMMKAKLWTLSENLIALKISLNNEVAGKGRGKNGVGSSDKNIHAEYRSIAVFCPLSFLSFMQRALGQRNPLT